MAFGLFSGPGADVCSSLLPSSLFLSSSLFSSAGSGRRTSPEVCDDPAAEPDAAFWGGGGGAGRRFLSCAGGRPGCLLSGAAPCSCALLFAAERGVSDKPPLSADGVCPPDCSAFHPHLHSGLP